MRQSTWCGTIRSRACRRLSEVLGKLAHAISTEEMRQLNYEVDANKRGQAEVVREWIKKKGCEIERSA